MRSVIGGQGGVRSRAATSRVWCAIAQGASERRKAAEESVADLLSAATAARRRQAQHAESDKGFLSGRADTGEGGSMSCSSRAASGDAQHRVWQRLIEEAAAAAQGPPTPAPSGRLASAQPASTRIGGQPVMKQASAPPSSIQSADSVGMSPKSSSAARRSGGVGNGRWSSWLPLLPGLGSQVRLASARFKSAPAAHDGPKAPEVWHMNPLQDVVPVESEDSEGVPLEQLDTSSSTTSSLQAMAPLLPQIVRLSHEMDASTAGDSGAVAAGVSSGDATMHVVTPSTSFTSRATGPRLSNNPSRCSSVFHSFLDTDS
jgi:hypothetical protein